MIALLLRAREPAAALAGYLAFDLDPLLLPAVLVALLTIAATRGRRTAAVAAAAAGTYLHERGKTTGLRARPGHPGGGPDPRGARTRPDIAGGPR